MKLNIIVLLSHPLRLVIMTSTLVLALSFIEPRVAYADAKDDAAQAAKDIDKAYQKAQENIPDKDIKEKEDALDKAAQDNDNTQGDPAKDPNKEKAQKKEDDARDKADKADPDKTGAPYRKALKDRREACKKLKKALAELRQLLQKRRKITSDNSDIEQAIRDAEKAEKEQKKTPEPPTLSMAVPQGSRTLATFITSGKIKIDSTGTGETIGHVADLKIQNLTDQQITCAIPPMILESGSGKNQHYACPTGQTVALNPHQRKTVPMNGVCLNRNKPPVGKGVSGDLVINEANPSSPQNPNSHIPATQAGDLLRICTSKYDAADKLQQEGALKNLPYKDKQKQKDIVVQWSTWCDTRISQITGAPPATKDDLRKVVYKQLESKKPMSPETKKKVDQGIDTIFEKVELTTAKAKDLENANLPAPGASSGPEVTPPPSGTNGPGQPSAADFQDPNAHFEGDEISDVAQMKGSSFFFRLSPNESVLIKISDIELVKNADGFVFLGKLIGERVWGSNRFEKFNIDNSPEYQKRGLTKVATLDDVNCGAPGSNNQVHFDKIRFRRLVTHGYPMLAITEMQGSNLLTNEALSGRLNIPDIVGRFVCPAVFDWDCWNTACSGYGCNLPACSCNGTGFCNWVIVGTKCVPTSCSGTCRNPMGWSSFCPCL
jgi:hypothetical protein